MVGSSSSHRDDRKKFRVFNLYKMMKIANDYKLLIEKLTKISHENNEFFKILEKNSEKMQQVLFVSMKIQEFAKKPHLISEN